MKIDAKQIPLAAVLSAWPRAAIPYGTRSILPLPKEPRT